MKKCISTHNGEHRPTPKMGSSTGFICGGCRKEVKATLPTLPLPDHEHGYTVPYLKKWLKEQKISWRKFDKAFGVNTVSWDEMFGCILYPCDVERALFALGHKAGVNHLWD